MGSRRDASLALLTLAAYAVLSLVVDAPLSVPFAVLGGAGTIAFELLASRDPDAVRTHWDRPLVQVAVVALAIGIGVGGALVAPGSVLSLCLGAVCTYLVLLALVRTGVLTPGQRR